MTRSSARKGQTGQTTETVEEAQTTQEATMEAEAVETDEQARLREAAEAFGSFLERPLPVRKQRTPKLTPKQIRFLSALRDNGDLSLAELVSAAGAGGVTEPHGFVYRMIAHGYLNISVSATAETMLPAEAPTSTEETVAA